MALFVGVDIGGTFTDLVIFNEETENAPKVFKVPTSPRQPEKAVIKALAQGLVHGTEVRMFTHATTIATNALLTHRGLAKTALVVNTGFRDLLEIGRQRRPEIYNLHTRRPVPIVERQDRLVVRERTLANGSQQEPLSIGDIEEVSRTIIKKRYDSVAIAFLNSYANPASEMQAEKILRESGFKGHINLSSEIDPQYREYERASTTVINSSLVPSISKYLKALKLGLERVGIACPVYVMNSDGTASTSSQASHRPISIIESGPAAGVLSSKYLANLLSLDKVITFDMGGTTAKAGTIVNGNPDLSYEFEAAGRTFHGRSVKGSGYPVRQPFIDLAEVSAGGGTIARLDETGSLKLGPDSAGADPGPVAYGKGGKEATVTDANIVAGRLNPQQLLGGRLKLQPELAVRAIGKLSAKLGISIEKTAENILQVVNNNMSKALSLVSIERGRDPREYTLIALGGAGPLHACDLAQEIGIKRIIVPLHSGLFSAFGLLTSELSRTFSKPIMRPVTGRIERSFEELRKQTKMALKREGFSTYKTKEQLDLRYERQAYEITVPYSKNENISRLFGREHYRLYGYSSSHTVEAVNARIRATIPTPTATIARKKLIPSEPPTSSLSRRVSLIGRWKQVPVYDREDLKPGIHGKGPCVIEEYDSTMMVGEGWSWRIDQYGSIDARNLTAR